MLVSPPADRLDWWFSFRLFKTWPGERKPAYSLNSYIAHCVPVPKTKGECVWAEDEWVFISLGCDPSSSRMCLIRPINISEQTWAGAHRTTIAKKEKWEWWVKRMCYEPQMQTSCRLSYIPSCMHPHYSADCEEHKSLMFVQEEKHPPDQACDFVISSSHSEEKSGRRQLLLISLWMFHKE